MIQKSNSCLKDITRSIVLGTRVKLIQIVLEQLCKFNDQVSNINYIQYNYVLCIQSTNICITFVLPKKTKYENSTFGY